MPSTHHLLAGAPAQSRSVSLSTPSQSTFPLAIQNVDLRLRIKRKVELYNFYVLGTGTLVTRGNTSVPFSTTVT